MEIQEFIKNFASEFEESDIKEFDKNTAFKNHKEWSSLTAMSIIAMVDEKYNVILTGDDIRKSTTINDIFELVKSKI